MPQVTVNPTIMSDGTAVTSFVDTVSTSAVTYTYPNSNDKLQIRNTGIVNLTVTVGSVTATVLPGEWRTIAISFTAFTIQAASGMGSFEARTIYAQNTQLRADAPRLLISIPYSSLQANATSSFFLDGALSRNARARTFSTYNKTDQAPTTYNARFYDSTIATNHRTTGGGTATATLTNTANSSGVSTETSEAIPLLASHVDSIHLLIAIGATAPTTGSIDIYVTELF